MNPIDKREGQIRMEESRMDDEGGSMQNTPVEDARTPDQVRRDIEEARSHLAATTVELRDKLAGVEKARGWIREHRSQAVGGAFALGLLLSMRGAISR